MKLPRRSFLHLAAGAVALPVIPRIACAQSYPTRPVRLRTPYRERLSERLGQPIIVDNRPGAGGNIGSSVLPFFQILELAGKQLVIMRNP